jgi:hypothetical protein
MTVDPELYNVALWDGDLIIAVDAIDQSSDLIVRFKPC